jgi:ribonuclease P/MRP protein subunit RPP40
MFQFTGGKKESTTCFATHGTTGHLDATQPPVRRKPYAALLAMPAVHKVRAAPSLPLHRC